ncbi:MAG: FeoB-associated Cys-rich membrane protein [Muribaculaceae bacterium]|nr:FeoB-associated Cys-rich membrane protein [Muribaculaceae bacterium]
MELYIQWIVVGVIVVSAVVWAIRRSRSKDDCSCGCGGCRLKDNCSSRKEPKK